MPDAQNTPQAPAGAQPGQAVDPIRNYNWKILIGGQQVADFVRCSWLEIVVDTIDYCEGGSPYPRKIPGRTHYPPITLEYGLTQSKVLWDWMQESVKQGPQGPHRQDVSIVMFGPDGNEHLLQWNLHGAWPSRWHGRPLDASMSQIAIASLELSFDYAEQD
jgi:phage tail-like protein